ncbi:GNAT family N-acetyltransferase [Maribacter sp. 2210JD10-5]|uniref:GNAT family N-acetyltransferase n=1 Tax=Maribacter sp. 2210JD10-5 TaxID=3386272 RepID=UPI0039BD28A1
MGITYSRARTASELKEILALQTTNLKDNVSHTEKESQGFITVSHTFDMLNKMNNACQHVIAKDNAKVIGYALAMLPSFRNEIPILTPMFVSADSLLGNKNYLVMGQICIDKNYRGKGIFKGMYTFYKNELSPQYDCLFTEVATENTRSLSAHKAIGFSILKTEIAGDVSWELMNWHW